LERSISAHVDASEPALEHSGACKLDSMGDLLGGFELPVSEIYYLTSWSGGERAAGALDDLERVVHRVSLPTLHLRATTNHYNV
jgi:hypothetical protein